MSDADAGGARGADRRVWGWEGTLRRGTLPQGSGRLGGPSGEERWVAIGANSDSMFQRLMTTIGRGDLAEDPALRHNDGRVASEAMLDQAIAALDRLRHHGRQIGVITHVEAMKAALTVGIEVRPLPGHGGSTIRQSG